MGDLMKSCGVINLEIPASLSPSKRRKLENSPENSPENSSSASPASAICSSSTSLDLNKKAEGFDTDFSIFNFKDFSEEITPLKEVEMEASSVLTPLSAAPAPSEAEIEEFFSAAEKYEQKRFCEKYNYDVVKDVPLEGRYQWLKL